MTPPSSPAAPSNRSANAGGSTAAAPGPQRFLPPMLALFVGSGCAALIYEIVWFQLLSLIIGSSAISLGVLLATFMGGMALGSMLLPRFVPLDRHPLRVYAFLELGIGGFGLLVLFGLPYVGGLYTAIGGGGVGGLLFRGLLCAVYLLPPTILMGATLPAIARWVEATPQGVAWMGWFYGGNIAGAVAGSLLAGFYLLRAFDMAIATYVAIGLNVLVALAALSLAGFAVYRAPAAVAKSERGALPPGAWAVYVAIGLSGATALAAEAVWTRLLTLNLGGTVYTFSLILGAFLTGLGIGSSGGSWFAKTVRNPRMALGLCQLGVVVAIAWAAYWLTEGLPYWPINPWLSSAPRFTFQIDVFRAALVTLPAAIFWGASFPLALAALASREQDPARLVGTVYAANTVGAILGALFGSLLVIAWLGTQHAQRVLIALAAVSALLMLAPVVRAETRRLAFNARSAAWAGGVLVLTLLAAGGVAPVPGMLVAYGRYMATRLTEEIEIVYMGEGMNSSMAVSRLPNGVLNYHNAGKVQASSEPQDMRLQRMLGHLTTLVPENPRSVLVIGCGAGVTAGAVSIDPAVERLTIAEIEPLVPEVVSTWFAEHNFDVINNPKTRVHVDDARHFLVTTDEKFDAITSDPFDPWVKGAATLYTREFFELVRRRLNPGGIVTVFVQLYESNLDAVKSEVATFLEAFPNGMVFGNTFNNQGYDVVLLGQLQPGPIDLDRIEARLSRPDYAPVAISLGEIGMYSIVDLFSTFAGQGGQLGPWLADAQINRDRNLRLQYLAGLGLNLYEQAYIYQDMVSHLSYPEGLFTGAPELQESLRARILWGGQ
ncbi:MAG: fused MFS/spermidine synthase [Gemmatimonadetes bacterium]|nr:fused MFS/spermidine synthase [Gemmatimonadota bacterium]